MQLINDEQRKSIKGMSNYWAELPGRHNSREIQMAELKALLGTISAGQILSIIGDYVNTEMHILKSEGGFDEPDLYNLVIKNGTKQAYVLINKEGAEKLTENLKLKT